jgi:hypothetical protein
MLDDEARSQSLSWLAARTEPDVRRHIAGIREFEAAGFTHVALVQVGADTRQQFIKWAATELLPALRAS